MLLMFGAGFQYMVVRPLYQKPGT